MSPGFSVVVPTYDRPRALRACLESLAKLDYPRDRFEVIVVDDGSPAELSPVVAPFHDRLDLKLLRQANAGPGAARNAGVAAARNEFVAFTDDDCAPHADWLTALAKALEADADVLVGGVCLNALPQNPYATASQMILDVVHAHFNRDAQHAVFFPSDNMAARRERLLEVGGFDASFRCSEDRDLCDRWSARGWRLVVAPEARVDHAHEMGLCGFCRQHFGYGRGAWRFHRARTERGAGPLEVAGGFYLKCFAEPFRTRPVHRALPLAALMVVWQAANTAGFVCEGLSSRRAPSAAARA